MNRDGDFPIGTVVRFQRVLAGRTYTYAAIRARGGPWYLTGTFLHTRKRITWEKLCGLSNIRSFEVWVWGEKL
jgi:hypothetical protein